MPCEGLDLRASLKLPEGWKFGTALPDRETRSETQSNSPPAPLTTLVDSPVLAGRYFREIELTPGQNPPHEMDIAADSQAALAMTPETELALPQSGRRKRARFSASRHYRDYHFLLTLSDDVAHFGLEHHESSDDRTSERSLIDERGAHSNSPTLLPHEFVHSWNGKYRRPAGLATPDYQQPMKDDLLWVYEGLTEYLGNVLTATQRPGNPRTVARCNSRSLSRHTNIVPAAIGGLCRTRPMPRPFSMTQRATGRTGAAARISTKKANSCGWT